MLPEEEEDDRPWDEKSMTPLAGQSYIDIGIMPGQSTTAIGRVWCTSCGTRFTSGQYDKFEKLVKEGKTNEEAMTILNIGGKDKRFCCRGSFSTPHWVPLAKSYYNPDLVRGLTNESNDEPWLKWRGNMMVNPKSDKVIKLRKDEPLPEVMRRTPEEEGITIPPGYRFVGWLRVDDRWTGKQVATWVPQIVETIVYIDRSGTN